MATRTTRGLFQLDDNMPNWHHYVNCNIDLMNAVIFRMLSLEDVTFEALQHGSFLKYDVVAQKWVVTYER